MRTSTDFVYNSSWQPNAASLSDIPHCSVLVRSTMVRGQLPFLSELASVARKSRPSNFERDFHVWAIMKDMSAFCSFVFDYPMSNV